MNLPIEIRQKLINENATIAVTGASGWFGCTTLDFLWEILGEVNFRKQVHAFSSDGRELSIGNKFTVHTRPLDKLPDLNSLDYLFHYAFLTRDRVEALGTETYIEINTSIIDIIISRLQKGDLKGVFLTSSGAVYGSNRVLIDPDRVLLANPYGALKRREEILLAETCQAFRIPCLTVRVFSVMGPYITKPIAYAIGDFTHQALRFQKIKVLAERPVWRSYTAVQDLVCLGLTYLVNSPKPLPLCIDSCGHVVEMEALAHQVFSALQLTPHVIDRRWDALAQPSRYVGEGNAIDLLASNLGLHFLPFEQQVTDTVLYLKAIWNL